MEHEFWHERWAKKEIGFHEGTVNQYLHDHWPELAGKGTDAVGDESARVRLRPRDHAGQL